MTILFSYIITDCRSHSQHEKPEKFIMTSEKEALICVGLSARASTSQGEQGFCSKANEWIVSGTLFLEKNEINCECMSTLSL